METRKSRLNADSPTPNSTGSESAPATPGRTRGSRKPKDTLPIQIPQMPDTFITHIKSNDGTNDNILPGVSPEHTTVDTIKDSVEISTDRSTLSVVPHAAPANTKTRISTRGTSLLSEPEVKKQRAKPGRKPGTKIAPKVPVKTKTVRKRRNSTGRIENDHNKPVAATKTRRGNKFQLRSSNVAKSLLKAPLLQTATRRKRGRKTDKTEDKSNKIKKEVIDASSDTELLKIMRRRSDSKCSDMTDRTDTSSFCADPAPKDQIDETSNAVEGELKCLLLPVEEPSGIIKLNEDTITTKLIDDGKEPVIVRPIILSDSGIANDSNCLTIPKSVVKPKRTLTRPRKSQSKDAIYFMAIQNEVKEMPAPLTIETEELMVDETTIVVPTNIDETMSPVLVSEGVSEISVKQFYGPDFLENNLGIEKDPKLGEIVQVEEKKMLQTSNNINLELTSNLETTIESQALKSDSNDNENAEKDNEILSRIDDSGHKTESIEMIDSIVHESRTVQEAEEIKSESTITSEIKLEEIIVKPSGGVQNDIKKEEKTIRFIENDDQKLDSNLRAIIDMKIKSDSEEEPILKRPLLDCESPELLKQKEKHLNYLGLLTVEAAEKEKQKRREFLQTSGFSSKLVKPKNSATEYTGTLKTVIKLHRPDKKRGRVPLKMTLHKGRGKLTSTTNDSGTINNGIERETNSVGGSDDEAYYTITNEVDNATENLNYGGQIRKTHNRTHASENTVEQPPETEPQPMLVIPEKASSFRFHPGKLCQDQCFYCGGKFGLFDTPCHVAQLKSLDRQKKILEMEKKLTIDSCLCDACFRHVDRSANCPSYKKRPPIQTSTATIDDIGIDGKKIGDEMKSSVDLADKNEKTYGTCLALDCNTIAKHFIRRKWIIKLRKSISQHFQLNTEVIQPMGLIPFCDKHNDMVTALMVCECSLCKRKLQRNHIFYLTQDTLKLKQILATQGIPIQIDSSSPVVCKLCRYYSNLLLKSPVDPNSQKGMFVKDYRRRILQFLNIEQESDDSSKTSATKELNLSQSEAIERNRNVEPQKRKRSARRQRKCSPETASSQSNDTINTDDIRGQSIGQIALNDDVIVDYDSSTQNVDGNSSTIKPLNLVVTQQKIKSPLTSSASSQSLLLLTKKQIEAQIQSKEDLSLLRSNPNISMRELFPGEEEMGLSTQIPFGVNAHRTPEGWSKIQTTMQYDEPTRVLWEELQKPYGNQSSFLRHLILLEKYFRNGELVLSQKATENAVTYSESVQNRLRSYDNISTVNAAASTINSSLSHLYQLSKAPISTTAPKLKTTTKLTGQAGCSSTLESKSSTSLLRQNFAQPQNVADFNASAALKRKSIEENKSRRDAKIPKINSDNQSILTASTRKPTNVPPELISLTQPNKTIQQQQHEAQNLLIQQQAKKQKAQYIEQNAVVTVSQTTNTSTVPSSSPIVSTNAAAGAGPTNGPSKSLTIIRLPDSLTAKERLESKTWRPTLLPVTSGQSQVNGQLYQTADGRKLPNLVQVQSGGRPYLISIHDYNRMCILRRERLLRDQLFQQQQLNNQPIAAKPTAGVSPQHKQSLESTNELKVAMPINRSTSLQSGQRDSLIKSSTHLGVSPTQSQPHSLTNQATIVKPNTTSTVTSGQLSMEERNNLISAALNKVSIPNKILEQNSVIPVYTISKTAGPNNNNGQPIVSVSNNNVLDLGINKQSRKTNPSSLLKSNSTISQIGPPPPKSAPSKIAGASPSHQSATQYACNNVISITSSSTTTPSSYLKSTTDNQFTNRNSIDIIGPVGNTIDVLIKTTPPSNQTDRWSWPDSLNPTLAGQLDPSAVSLLSKIPKSLTVIPQQKSRTCTSRRTSEEGPSA